MCPRASISNYKNTSNRAASNLTGVFCMKSNVFSICAQVPQCVPSNVWELNQHTSSFSNSKPSKNE